MNCIICGREIQTADIYVPVGFDGDFAHKSCEEHKDEHYTRIDNMSTDMFIGWLLGGESTT